MPEAGGIYVRWLGRAGHISGVLCLLAQVSCIQFARCELAALSLAGKPTSQSSNENLSPSAVDGNLASFQYTATGDPHPWWKVDLVSEHCLGNVIVSLRKGCCGQQRFTATVVRAGLSSSYIENQPCGSPATGEQSMDGAVNEFLCDPPRPSRYISLDIDPASPGVKLAILQIAELEAEEYTAGECDPIPDLPEVASAHFKRFHKGSLITNHSALSTKVTASPLQCARHCMKHAQCFSFDFARNYRECHIYSLNSTDIETSPNDDFSVYVLLK